MLGSRTWQLPVGAVVLLRVAASILRRQPKGRASRLPGTTAGLGCLENSVNCLFQPTKQRTGVRILEGGALPCSWEGL